VEELNKIAIPIDYVNSAHLQVTYEITWDSAHDMASAGLWIGVAAHVGAYAQRISDKFHLQRACLLFDTSPLNGRSVNAVRYLFVTESNDFREDDPDYAQLHLVQGNFSSPVVGSDYGVLRLSTVSGGFIPCSGITYDLSSPNVIDLNATALGWLNLSGNTKLAQRILADIDDLEPSGNNKLIVSSDSSVRDLAPVTNAATNVEALTARLNGLYRGIGYPQLDIEYTGDVIEYPYLCFVWGEEEAYDHETPAQRDIAVGSSFSEAISGLSAGTTYNYKARLYTAAETYKDGDAASFATLALPLVINKSYALARERL